MRSLLVCVLFPLFSTGASGVTIAADALVDFVVEARIESGAHSVSIRHSTAWQSTGLMLETGDLFALTATGEASPHIDDVLAKGLSMAQAVVVLMTPDDEARLQPRYHQQDEPSDETVLTGQPRPNVFIEAGMALASLPDRNPYPID